MNAHTPAFPYIEPGVEHSYGLSKRELIAAIAMAGCINIHAHAHTEVEKDVGVILMYTDELIKQIDKKK